VIELKAVLIHVKFSFDFWTVVLELQAVVNETCTKVFHKLIRQFEFELDFILS